MNTVDNVIWSEGMFLRPQHFQQHDRYIEAQLTARAISATHYFWGFNELAIDRSTLAQGRFALKQASGFFKDGTHFKVDSGTGLEELVIPTDISGELVGLAIPSRQASVQQVAFDEGQDLLARYKAMEVEVTDTSDISLGEVTLQLGRLQLRLMLERDIDSNYEFLPVARIRGWDNKNAVTLDENYIPPTLNLNELKNALYDHVVKISDILNEQSKRIANRLAHRSIQGASSSSINLFMMLSVINRYYAYFYHLRHSNFHHPEKLFCQLQMLLNEMAVFLFDSRSLEKLEHYNHDDLQLCFDPLMSQLTRALNIVLEDPYVVIELVDKGRGVQMAQVNDLNLMTSADFILGVSADMPLDNLRKRFPSHIKLGPAERIRDLVQLQLPGVHLLSLDQIPPQLPYHSGYVYFALEQSGELWQQFARSGNLALHLAGEFTGLEMEFWAVRRSKE